MALAQLNSATVYKKFIQEDAPKGDVTTQAIFGRQNIQAHAVILAKQDLVVSGFYCVKRLLKAEFPRLKLNVIKKDGSRVKKGMPMAQLNGPIQDLLLCERVMLNILAHLSGVATLTRRFVDLKGKRKVVILDTRKTMPVWRSWERLAVHDGGGHNHRMSLSDQYLIKDNHVALIGSVEEAIKRVYRHRKRGGFKAKVEVEVKDLRELRDALSLSPDVILLDNMNVVQIKQAVSLRRQIAPKVQLEVSGGVTLKNFKKWLKLGVERISIGSLTHSAPAVDISLIIPRKGTY